MDKSELEIMIKEYSTRLMQLNEKRSLPDDTPKAEPPAEPEEETVIEESASEEMQESTVPAAEDEADRAEIADIPGLTETEFYQQEEEAPSFSSEEPENYALFSAYVYAGENIYAIEGAKVCVYRKDEIFSFLTTDKNGKTKTVKLPSFPESNSLDPESDNRSLDYYADVFADGFTPRKELLVSAVGGSTIVLDVSMTPKSDEVM